MSELDEAAVEAAAAVVRELVTNAYWIESTREIVTAYLAAAARPTPDADAMEREFVGALGKYGIARTAYFRGEDVTWSSVQDSEQAVMALFRKAATR